MREAEPIREVLARDAAGKEGRNQITWGLTGHRKESGFYPKCDGASPGGVESYLFQRWCGEETVQEQSGGDTSYKSPDVNMQASHWLYRSRSSQIRVDGDENHTAHSNGQFHKEFS